MVVLGAFGAPGATMAGQMPPEAIARTWLAQAVPALSGGLLAQAGAADLGSYKVSLSGPLGDFVESGVFELSAADAAIVTAAGMIGSVKSRPRWTSSTARV